MRALSAAQSQAEELGTEVCVVVVDAGGNLKALIRMDGALFLTFQLAQRKARTAAGLGVVTQDFAAAVSGSQALLAGLSAQPDIALLPGGMPIADDGAIIGGIGVAGGQRGEDHPIAQAALAALSR
jgi:glc operon protein GlcG